MKNSAPNRFIYGYIFKKATTSEGAHSPSDTPPLRRATATARADAPFLTFKIWPRHFENRSATYDNHRLGQTVAI